MRKKRTFISFDWALKHLLREKANHDVLEGFVSVILSRAGLKVWSRDWSRAGLRVWSKTVPMKRQRPHGV